MATIKSYTDLSQSKTLSKIFPFESADMFYNLGESQLPNVIYGNFNDFKCYLPCWSLSSLLNVLPYPQLSKDKLGSGKVGWMVSVYPNNCRYDSCWHDNAVDACVDMIEKLHELNLL